MQDTSYPAAASETAGVEPTLSTALARLALSYPEGSIRCELLAAAAIASGPGDVTEEVDPAPIARMYDQLCAARSWSSPMGANMLYHVSAALEWAERGPIRSSVPLREGAFILLRLPGKL